MASKKNDLRYENPLNHQLNVGCEMHLAPNWLGNHGTHTQLLNDAQCNSGSSAEVVVLQVLFYHTLGSFQGLHTLESWPAMVATVDTCV